MTEPHPRYDIFLSHTSADKAAVEMLAERLRAVGLEPFLDNWHLVPGEPWQEGLEKALDASRSCAVFIGPNGIGAWENEEMRDALDQRTNAEGYRVIPVLLPGARMPEKGPLPRFLLAAHLGRFPRRARRPRGFPPPRLRRRRSTTRFYLGNITPRG